MIEWLNQNSGAIQGISTVSLVAITTYYAIQTRKQVEIAKRQIEFVEIQLKSKVKFTTSEVYYGSSDDEIENDHKVKVVLANVGLRDLNIVSLGVFDDNHTKTFIDYSELNLPQLLKPGNSIRHEYDYNELRLAFNTGEHGTFQGFCAEDATGEEFQCKYTLSNHVKK